MILLIGTPNKPNKAIIILSIFSLVWLGLSKQQYMPLASIFSLALATIMFVRWRATTATFIYVMISFLTPLSYNYFNNTDSDVMKGINFANKTDTFLGAVLPEAKDQELALSILGLPKSCLSGIGKTWYSPGFRQNHTCPEIQQTSRARLLPLFILEPATFFVPMYKATRDTRPFHSRFLGYLEDADDVDSVKYKISKATSLSTLVAALPIKIYFFIALIAMISGPVFIFLLIIRCKDNRGDDEFYRLVFGMIGLGGIVTLYAIASSVFGDGYADIQKHAVAFMIGISFQLGGILVVLISTSCTCWLNYSSADRKS